jgi:toxoflavin biosynthesis protein ToxD
VPPAAASKAADSRAELWQTGCHVDARDTDARTLDARDLDARLVDAHGRSPLRRRGALLAALLAAGAGWLLLGGHPSGQGRPAPLGELVRIPAGPARLGSDAREKAYGYTVAGAAARDGRWFDAERARRVVLPAFDIEATPVTQAAYARFVLDTTHRAPGDSESAYQAQGNPAHPYAQVRDYLWQEGRPPDGREQHPVVLVSQLDAASYCMWRGLQARRSCRLPSENEWEKAARDNDLRYYPWGDAWEPARLNSREQGPGGTTPVGAYPGGRSPYGLSDMAGNVLQWTSTAGDLGQAVLKGCGWDAHGGSCRSAARQERPVNTHDIVIGFRCLCQVEGSSGR